MSAFRRMSPSGTWTDGRRIRRTRFKCSQNSFHETASGPPISNSPPVAVSRSTARVKYSATSSTQIGWMRWRPLPMIGVTGVSRASFTKVGRIPPSRPKMKLGRKITNVRPDPLTRCSVSHFAR